MMPRAVRWTGSTLEVERAESACSREVWWFRLDPTPGPPQTWVLRLVSYAQQARPSARHKWRQAPNTKSYDSTVAPRSFGGGDLSPGAVPLPPEACAVARAELRRVIIEVPCRVGYGER